MIVVAHNLLAANANRQLGITTEEQKKSSEKLSSGYRINRAADDAAGLSISEKLRYQVRGLERGQKNTMDGVSWCQVGDGALQEVQEMVQRIRELAVQASNDTNTPEDRAAINEEVKALRREINQTSYNAMFNSQHIFESKEASFGVVGVPNDLGVYTANKAMGGDQITVQSMPDTSNNVSVSVNTDNYGGLIFDGNRIPWGELRNSNSQNRDIIGTADNPDTLKDGGYYWENPDGSGRFFNLRVDEDATGIPNYTREMTIQADLAKGIIVDGKVIPWSSVVDEEGVAMSDATKHDGVWSFNYYGADVGFYLTGIEFMDDVVQEINAPHMDRMSYSWEVPYTGAEAEQAVYATDNQKVHVTNEMKKTLYDNYAHQDQNQGYYFVGADKNGIWLKDADGKDVPNSRKSWVDLFTPDKTDVSIPSPNQTWEDWVKGGQLSHTELTYTYKDLDGDADDTQVEFSFHMSDITGLDDVIEGLNGMPIGGGTETSYKISDITKLTSPNSHVSVESMVRFSYEDEKTLGRDFNQQAYDLATGTFAFDETQTTKKASVTLVNGGNTITLKADFDGISTASDLENKLMSGVDEYIEKIIAEKIRLVELGEDAQDLANLGNIKGHSTSVAAVFVSEDEDGKYNGGIDSEISSAISYNHSDLRNSIEVTMAEDVAGDYVLNADGKTYSHKNSLLTYPTGTKFYKIEIDYAGFGNKADLLNDRAKNVMAATFGLEKSGSVYTETPAKKEAKVQLSPTDYTYTTLLGKEKPNSANRSQFKSVVVKTPQRYGIHIQNSSNVGDNLLIEKFAMNTVELGLFAIHTRDYEGAQKTIGACDNAMAVLNDRRSYFGASQNRLEHTYANSANAEENQQAAESRIRDTDMAEEMVKYSKNNILAQAGQSMLAQANQGTQGILNLLQ